MPCYYFYQKTSESKWQVVEDRGHPATLKKVMEAGAIKMSILGVDTAEPENNKLEAKYKGPWYADIDCAGDIPLAAQSTIKLVDKLVALDIPQDEIHIFASGKKGFHVIVEAKKFCDGKPRKLLPLVYKAMAAQLYVVGLDLGVYSLGKGVCWRIENTQRDDTGTYRVRITYDELQGMDTERYLSLVQHPREFPKSEPDPAVAVAFRNLFHASGTIVAAQQKDKQEEVPEDLAKIREEIPSCAIMVSEAKTLPEKNFNEVAMQFSAYLARVNPPEIQQDRLIEKFVESYATEHHPVRVRKEALSGLLGYVKDTSSFKFSCAGMRSILTFNKCKECAIYRSSVKVDTAKKLGIEVREDGYYTTGEQAHRITSFTIKPTAVLKEYNHDGDKAIRTACLVELHEGDITVPDVVWDEGSWKSKSAVISQISGIRNFGFFGSDVDVQKIKNLVLEGEDDMSEIIRVYSAGMHIRRVAGKAMFTYVEPDFSVNSQGVRDLYKLTGAVPSPVHMKSVKLLTKEDVEAKKSIEEGLRNLLQVNSPVGVAKILGWVSACHLKMHIRNSPGMDSAFPLLGLHGSAQSGKNKTAELFCWLNGCRFGTEQSVFNVPGAKPFPITNLLITATTIPRIIDELNVERVHRSLFNHVVELIKCSWDCASVPRGTVSQVSLSGAGQTSAKLVEQYVTAPVIYCSEQEISSNTALMQRTVPVHLSAKTRDGRGAFFEAATHHREDFNVFARHLIQSALSTPVEAIPKLLNANQQYIPSPITDRARHCFLVIFLGLDFFQHNYKEMGLDLDKEFNEVKQALIDHLSDSQVEIVKEKNWSNIDTVLDVMALLASFAQDPKMQTIIPGQHCLVDHTTNRLYLNSLLAHWFYKDACKNQGDTPLISTHKNFLKIAKEQPYFETDSFIDPAGEILGGNKCLVLKLDKLREKGIAIELFESRDVRMIA